MSSRGGWSRGVGISIKVYCVPILRDETGRAVLDENDRAQVTGAAYPVPKAQSPALPK
jgi:hypothetical protein